MGDEDGDTTNSGRSYDGKAKIWSLERRECVATQTESDKCLWAVRWLPKAASARYCTAKMRRPVLMMIGMRCSLLLEQSEALASSVRQVAYESGEQYDSWQPFKRYMLMSSRCSHIHAQVEEVSISTSMI